MSEIDPECHGHIRMSVYGACMLGTTGCTRPEHLRTRDLQEKIARQREANRKANERIAELEAACTALADLSAKDVAKLPWDAIRVITRAANLAIHGAEPTPSVGTPQQTSGDDVGRGGVHGPKPPQPTEAEPPTSARDPGEAGTFHDGAGLTCIHGKFTREPCDGCDREDDDEDPDQERGPNGVRRDGDVVTPADASVPHPGDVAVLDGGAFRADQVTTPRPSDPWAEVQARADAIVAEAAPKLAALEALSRRPNDELTPCTHPYEDCAVCHGTGQSRGDPCPACVMRKWYADGVATGTLATLEEVEANRAEQRTPEALTGLRCHAVHPGEGGRCVYGEGHPIEEHTDGSTRWTDKAPPTVPRGPLVHRRSVASALRDVADEQEHAERNLGSEADAPTILRALADDIEQGFTPAEPGRGSCAHPEYVQQRYGGAGHVITAWCSCCGAFRLEGYAQWHAPRQASCPETPKVDPRLDVLEAAERICRDIASEPQWSRSRLAVEECADQIAQFRKTFEPMAEKGEDK